MATLREVHRARATSTDVGLPGILPIAPSGQNELAVARTRATVLSLIGKSMTLS